MWIVRRSKPGSTLWSKQHHVQLFKSLWIIHKHLYDACQVKSKQLWYKKPGIWYNITVTRCWKAYVMVISSIYLYLHMCIFVFGILDNTHPMLWKVSIMTIRFPQCFNLAKHLWIAFWAVISMIGILFPDFQIFLPQCRVYFQNFGAMLIAY